MTTANTTTEKIVSALQQHGGSVSAAATELNVSRQAIYHHIETNPVIAAALEKTRADIARKRKPLARVLRKVSFLDGEVARYATEKSLSTRAAARELVIEKLTTITGRSERDVMTEIRGSTALSQAFEDLLPPIGSGRSEDPRETMNTSLTAKQLAWIRSQPDGTVAKLLAAAETFPEASDTTEPKTQTTFSVRAVDAARLRVDAAKRGETTQTLIRQVIEVARRQAVAARAAR